MNRVTDIGKVTDLSEFYTNVHQQTSNHQRNTEKEKKKKVEISSTRVKCHLHSFHFLKVHLNVVETF